MPALTGAQYIDWFRDHPPNVWIDGERVKDVVSHPAFRNNIRTMASLYDMQHDPVLHDEMTYCSPTSGEPVGLSFIQPANMEQLEARGRMMFHWARATVGMMGRSPDFMNVTVTAFGSAQEYFGQRQPEFGKNIRAYCEYIRENDVVLTHALLNPLRRRDVLRGTQAVASDDVGAHVVRETDAGVIVRGCRMLATLPIAHEIAVYPIRPDSSEKHAICFALPCDTPGMKFLCRESFDYGRSHFDHPLSSRFEELDAVVLFDDVLVPWERVFILRDVEIANGITAHTNFLKHSGQQICQRRIAKSEFLLGLAAMMVETLGRGNEPHVQEMLGELAMYVEIMKATLRAGISQAAFDQYGVFTPSHAPLTAGRDLYARNFYPRMAEIIHLLGSSSLMALPVAADFDSELEPSLERYMATDTMPAVDRARVFHLAWDLTCSAFGSRQTHYERFFAGDPVYNAIVGMRNTDLEPAKDMVREFLAR